MRPGPLAAYLAARLDEGVTVRDARRAFPGLSRETWFVDVATASGDPIGLVLRVDSVGSETPFPLEREWELYRRLWPTPIPVPEPLWYDDGGPLTEGRPLVARRRVDGSPRPPGVVRGPAGATARRLAALRVAEQLATLHRLDWSGYGFDEVLVPPPADDPYGVEFAIWRAVWENGRTDPFPLVTEALHWLYEARPTDAARIALLKGNNGLGEEIWRDGKIVALVDWELAALGDPALDLAFSQGLLAEAPDDVLAVYAALTGDTIDPYRLAFATLWVTFKSLCCLNACGLRSHLDGRGRRSHRVNLGMGVAKNLERILGSVVGLDVVDAHRRIATSMPGNGYLAGLGTR